MIINEAKFIYICIKQLSFSYHKNGHPEAQKTNPNGFGVNRNEGKTAIFFLNKVNSVLKIKQYVVGYLLNFYLFIIFLYLRKKITI